MRMVQLIVAVTDENFDEASYLRNNFDVEHAVKSGELPSGQAHFEKFGRYEGRFLRQHIPFDDLRRSKMEKLKPLLRSDMPHEWQGDKVNYLSDALREETRIFDTKNVSQNYYGPEIVELVESVKEGLVLDCGAGKRSAYYDNVVNFEIVDYDTTDVLGVGEELPFEDATFDGVISIAVLEHVRDPFRCAGELIRVLKPGGRLICAAPFQSILHGFPHHFFNMSHQGLRSLFEQHLRIDDQKVLPSELPIWNLSALLASWANGLPATTREAFLNMPVRELAKKPYTLLDMEFVTQLSEEKNFELASGTVLFATKPE